MAEFEQERQILEAEWFAKKDTILAYLENIEDKREKLKYLLSIIVKDRSRMMVNITEEDLTDKNEWHNPCKDGNMHNKDYIDYVIACKQNCNDYFLYFINDIFSLVTRGHWQFAYYNDRDPLLDIVNLYLTNNLLNDQLEEFIDGFLEQKNNDITFNM